MTRMSSSSTDESVMKSAVVRFAGDSGDGMQLTGGQFTLATALSGNRLSTFPDFPAEIRAPAGTTFGVSAFQIHFGGGPVRTAGDELDVLVAMNPAALKTNLADLKPSGLLIMDAGAFGGRNLRKAGYETSPLEDDSLSSWRTLPLDIHRLTQEAVADCGVSNKEAQRARNMWALGLVLWLFGRDTSTTENWLNSKFAKKPEILAANLASLKAGHNFGETAELSEELPVFQVVSAPRSETGRYSNVTGAEALAWGLAAGCQLAKRNMTFCSYPITPATQLLHLLSRLRSSGVLTFQAEDEIAAACAAIGASYAGTLGVTASSGPGIALKTEALGLAIATELPLVVVNAQRGGPSTGLPTKTEQSDLFQALWGRNADSPMPVLASRTPSDCFEVAIEAVRLAVTYMTPVMLLTDGYLQNAAEPWRIPTLSDYRPFPKPDFTGSANEFQPYARDKKTLSRPWVVPGTFGLAHRIGGLERAAGSGEVSYDPANHQRMTNLRQDKVLGIARDIPEQTVNLGPDGGKLAVVGWGSTYGPIHRAVEQLLERGQTVSHIHLRHLWPLPRNLREVLSRFDRVLVPEMNNGQLITLLRAECLCPAEGLNKVTGKPFKISEIENAIMERLEN